MRVREIMSAPVQVCSPRDTLEYAARLLWDNNCGVLPVVDANGRVGAAITDRDICMSAYTKGARLADLQVHDAMSRHVASCRAEDTVTTAARTMGEKRVRRLPVLDDDGRICGLLSLNDLARAAPRDAELEKAVLQTLTAVCTGADAAEGAVASSTADGRKGGAGESTSRS